MNRERQVHVNFTRKIINGQKDFYQQRKTSVSMRKF